MPKKEDLIYFLSLELENVRCFGSPMQPLYLTDEYGNPARWTLLLGENGLGKTTLSECLLWMQFVPSAAGVAKDHDNPAEGITEGPMEPSLPEAANDLIEGFIRNGCDELEIKATFSQGIPLGRKMSKNEPSLPIRTAINILFKDKKIDDFKIHKNENSRIEDILGGKYKEPFVITYGANRAIGAIRIKDDELESYDSRSNFLYDRLSGKTELYNPEEILSFYETKALKSRGKRPKNGKDTHEEELFNDFKQIIADILPIDEINIKDIKVDEGLIYINTFSGKEIPFSALSFGYQSTIALTIDIAWRLSQKYPKSETPRNEPATIFIDEVDLHLHPRWQRTIVEKLSSIFTGAQFIATSHSPLMVQAAKHVNLAVLQKTGDKVCIENELETVFGWRVDQLRVDQILYSPIFGIDHSRGPESEKLFSDRANLLKKTKLTAKDKIRLSEISDEISDLPISSDLEELSFLRKAAELKNKHTEKQ
ncbi:MAG: AAA family ATPase [Pyrinomonadaceae bacterium]